METLRFLTLEHYVRARHPQYKFVFSVNRIEPYWLDIALVYALAQDSADDIDIIIDDAPAMTAEPPQPFPRRLQGKPSCVLTLRGHEREHSKHAARYRGADGSLYEFDEAGGWFVGCRSDPEDRCYPQVPAPPP